jgi:transcriptional regulator of aromatic amino acid metabolism
MKTKSNMTVSKLQSEAVLEFKKNYGNIIQLASGVEGGQMSTSNIHFIDKDVEQFLSDQIQKAVEETISECKRTVLETLPIYVVGKSSPFEIRNEERDSLLKKLESLSIQSKEK